MEVKEFQFQIPSQFTEMKSLQDIERILDLMTDFKLDTISETSCRFEFQDMPTVTSDCSFKIEAFTGKDLVESTVPSNVISLLDKPRKTPSPSHINYVGGNLAMPFKSPYLKELERRTSLLDISFPRPRVKTGRYRDDFIVYPLTDGACISPKREELKDVKHATTSAESIALADFMSDVSFRNKHKSKISFDRYSKIIEDYLDSNLKASDIFQTKSVLLDNESVLSIPEEIISVLSPSEQQIYKRAFGDKMRYSGISKNVLGMDEEVQTSSAMTSIETMAESARNSSSMQTINALPYSCTRGTQTGLRNIDRVLVLLPQDKVTEEGALQQIIDEQVKSKLENVPIKTAPQKCRKTVRIDPRFIKNESPHSEGGGISAVQSEPLSPSAASIKDKKRQIPLFKHTVMK